VLRRLLAVLVGLVIVGGEPVRPSLARFNATALAGAAMTTDTLAPPTGLAGVGGSSVTLTWAPSLDLYATGYSVFRSATAGGPYTFVEAVTPGTASSVVDSPPAGSWYYTLQTTYQGWTSVDSSEVGVTVGSTTPFVPCVSTAADTTGAGDNDGYQKFPARACSDDSSFAVDTNSGTGGTQSCGTGSTPVTTKDRHRFYGFVLGLPSSVTSVDGIRVRADLRLDRATGSHNVCAQLSWNSGASWTTIKTLAVTTAAETTYIFGSTADTWGRSWTAGQLSGSNFRVRIIDASTVPSRDFRLDYVAVSVAYTP
jgi:hypothetical protein